MAGSGILLPLGPDTATSRGIQFTGNGAGPGVYGSYIELSAALPYDCCAIQLHFEGGQTGVRGRFRLAIGAASSEVVIAADIPVSFTTSQGDQIFLPLALPEGARLSLAVDYDYARTGRVTANLTPAYPWYPAGYRYAVGIGAWTGVNAGGTAHTKSAYINHTTSLVAGIKAFIFALAQNANDDTSYVLADLEYDGNVIATLPMDWNGYQAHPPNRVMVTGAFAAGTTVRSRHQCSATTTNSGRTMNHSLIGLG